MELAFYKSFYADVKETVNKKNNAENKVKELKFILKMYSSKLTELNAKTPVAAPPVADKAPAELPLEGVAVNV